MPSYLSLTQHKSGLRKQGNGNSVDLRQTISHMYIALLSFTALIAAQYEIQIEEKMWQIEKTSVQLYSYSIERYIYAWCEINDDIRSKNVFQTQVLIKISGPSFLFSTKVRTFMEADFFKGYWPLHGRRERKWPSDIYGLTSMDS